MNATRSFRIAFLPLILTISGCQVSTPTGVIIDGKDVEMTEVFPTLKSQLSRYEGQKIGDLVSVLGIPDDEKTIAGIQVIYWQLDRLVAAGVDKGFNKPIIIKGKCTISAAIDNDQLITTTEAKGNNGGCSEILKKFDQGPKAQ